MLTVVHDSFITLQAITGESPKAAQTCTLLEAQEKELVQYKFFMNFLDLYSALPMFTFSSR
jgi:hypothetical protein